MTLSNACRIDHIYILASWPIVTVMLMLRLGQDPWAESRSTPCCGLGREEAYYLSPRWCYHILQSIRDLPVGTTTWYLYTRTQEVGVLPRLRLLVIQTASDTTVLGRCASVSVKKLFYVMMLLHTPRSKWQLE